jgi:ABC-2 type transport system ATP-binding protein
VSIIETRQLVREYAPRRGVRDVTLSVEEGECVALLGRNGSGKSTLTRLLLGLERPQSGSLSVFGKAAPSGIRHSLQRMGVVFDSSVHWDALSGLQNGYFMARTYGIQPQEAERRLTDLFGRAGLRDQAEDAVSTYSYGMRRKLSIIQALCHDPDLLLMDEPTAGVDAHFLATLTDLIRQRCSRGKTTWIAGNDAEWIAGVATRVVFMDEARVTAQGSVEELVAKVSPLKEVRVTLEDFAAVPQLIADGIRSFSQEGNILTALMERDPDAMPRLVEWVVSRGGKVRNIEVMGSSLRDAFLLSTGKTLEK